MNRALPLLALAGCASLKALPDDQACKEAGYAIARRTFECTGDGDLANSRYVKFEATFECLPLPEYTIDTAAVTVYLAPEDTAARGLLPPDFFHCGWAIEQLSCELVDEYGDDLWRYLTASDACAWVIAPKEGA